MLAKLLVDVGTLSVQKGQNATRGRIIVSVVLPDKKLATKKYKGNVFQRNY